MGRDGRANEVVAEVCAGVLSHRVTAITIATNIPMATVITLKVIDFFTTVLLRMLCHDAKNAFLSLFSLFYVLRLFKTEQHCVSFVQLLPPKIVEVTAHWQKRLMVELFSP